MIELLERKEALACNQNLASFIVDLQVVRYDPTVNDNLYKAGEIMYVEDGSESRGITQEEADNWNKEAIDEYERGRDHIKIISTAHNFKGSIVYQCAPAAIHTYASHLAACIKELSEQLNWESIIFLLDYSTPWLQQENDYEPVKRAMDYLRQLGMDQKFTGGIKASGSELLDFVEHLFWVTRCNGSMPDCYFSGIESHTVLSICKHGNVHGQFYSEEEKNNVRKVANRIGMIEIRDGLCNENFSETGSIEGRQIIV